MNKIKLFKELEKYIIKNDVKSIDKIIFKINDFIMVDEKLKDDFFDELLSIFSHSEFYSLVDSWHALDIFGDNLEFFTYDQKDKLLRYLKSSYLKFEDYTTCFRAVEIISELFGDQKSLNALICLSTIDEPDKRAIVAHGFQHIINVSNVKGIIVEAYKNLKRMENDSDRTVKERAEREIGFIPEDVFSALTRKSCHQKQEI